MQDAVNLDVIVKDLEVESPFVCSKAEENFSVPVNSPKALILEVFQILLLDLEFFKKLELFQRAELRDLSSANLINDDLKHNRPYTQGARR